MNVEIGTEAGQFPEKEYINGIFVAVQGQHCDIGGPHCGHDHVYAVDCGIAQVPSWLTRGNIATLVVLIVAMFMYTPKIVVLLRFRAG